MKKLSILILIAGLTFSLGSCEKDEVEDPTTSNPNVPPADTTGTNTIVEVDVFDLAQNNVKADGISTDRLYRTLASKFIWWL